MAIDPKGMSTKHKVTAGIIVVIFIFIIWQVIAMFKGEGDEAPPEPTPTIANGKPAGAPGSNPVPQQPTGPQPAQIASTVTREQQMEMTRLQQETQSKYIAGLNELQLLKLARDIAQINSDIAQAKLAMINSQKEIVNKLSPKAPTPESQIPYGRGMVNPQVAAADAIEEGTGRLAGLQPLTPQVGATTTVTQGQNNPAANYTVISVTELMGRWNAVIGLQGKLYNVAVGDTLPADSSTVKSIDRSGVTLQKDGASRKILLVPII